MHLDFTGFKSKSISYKREKKCLRKDIGCISSKDFCSRKIIIPLEIPKAENFIL